MKPSVQCVTTLEGLQALQPDWEALEARDPLCTPFTTWDWCQLWWYHYGAGATLNILTVHADGRLVGLLPLYRREEKDLHLVPMQVLRFIGSGSDTSPDYLSMLVAPGFLEPVVTGVVAALQQDTGWQKLHLAHLDTASPVNARLTEALLGEAGKVVLNRRRIIHYDRLPDTWDAWRMSLSRKRRKQLNHRQNRLDNAGRWTVALCHGEAQIEHGVAALVRLHRQRWLSKSRGDDYAGAFASSAFVDFHRGVIQRFSRRRQLWLATLELEGDIIAAMYCFYWRDTLLFLQSGFSPEHEDLSPGHILFTATIAHGIESGVREIDLFRGDPGSLQAYARLERSTTDFTLVRPAPVRLIGEARQWMTRLLAR